LPKQLYILFGDKNKFKQYNSRTIEQSFALASAY